MLLLFLNQIAPTCSTYSTGRLIQNKFAKTPLEHHSFYHSFKFSKEEGKTSFLGKLYPQDLEYGPKTGIQLIKYGMVFDPVGPAAFRIEKLELDKVFKSLQNYFSTMPPELRIRVSSSWEALRKTLESLPGRSDNLLKMKMQNFPYSWMIVYQKCQSTFHNLLTLRNVHQNCLEKCIRMTLLMETLTLRRSQKVLTLLCTLEADRIDHGLAVF